MMSLMALAAPYQYSLGVAQQYFAMFFWPSMWILDQFGPKCNEDPGSIL